MKSTRTDNSASEVSACEAEREEAIENADVDVELFTPSCDKEGYYEEVQCRKLTELKSQICYCVNPKSGERIRGTLSLNKDNISCSGMVVCIISTL